MISRSVTIKVPATTANLGPGFDCLGLALDLWNRSTFSLAEAGFQVNVSGEGADRLPSGAGNMMVKAFLELYRRMGQPPPTGLLVDCENAIPLGSGLGSSSAAVLSGLVAANAMLNNPFNSHDLLRIANNLEGHADNAAAALYGGLVAVFSDTHGDTKVHKLDCAYKKVVVVLPNFRLSTRKARQSLPRNVEMGDAIFNIGHAIIGVEALRSGNRDLLMTALEDRLHQPYRLQLIPGAERALQAARNLGAPAVLSGAGPSILAFPGSNSDKIISVMQEAFASAGLTSRAWQLDMTYTGLNWELA